MGQRAVDSDQLAVFIDTPFIYNAARTTTNFKEFFRRDPLSRNFVASGKRDSQLAFFLLAESIGFVSHGFSGRVFEERGLDVE